MFKSAFIYKIKGLPANTAEALDDAFQLKPFAACSATQDKATGWVAPREANGLLVESIDGHLIAKLAIETKSVPKSEIDKHVAAAAAHIEQTTGRKPGKKETRELKEDALISLLPNAFAKRKDVPVWIDPKAGLMVIGAAAQSAADEVISILFYSIDNLLVSQLCTVRSPQGVMTDWLLAEGQSEIPGQFSIERECVLKSNEDDAATVKFSKHHLDNDDVRKHITEGKLPTQLALSWDGRVSLVLNESMQLKKIQFLDGVLDGGDKHEDRFDADVALSTGTLGPMIAELIESMGGEHQIVEGGEA